MIGKTNAMRTESNFPMISVDFTPTSFSSQRTSSYRKFVYDENYDTTVPILNHISILKNHYLSNASNTIPVYYTNTATGDIVGEIVSQYPELKDLPDKKYSAYLSFVPDENIIDGIPNIDLLIGTTFPIDIVKKGTTFSIGAAKYISSNADYTNIPGKVFLMQLY